MPMNTNARATPMRGSHKVNTSMAPRFSSTISFSSGADCMMCLAGASVASPQQNALRRGNITSQVLVIRRSPIRAQGDEPEQQDSAEEQHTDMLMTPWVLCCRSEAAHVPVSNPNRFPNTQPQLTTLESEKTGCDGSD